DLGHSDLEQPAFAVGGGVQPSRGVHGHFVECHDVTGDRGVEVGDGIRRLDLSAGLTGGDGVADLGQVDVDDLAEGVGGDGGDADLDGLADELVGGTVDPLVLSGVGVVFGQRGQLCYRYSFSATHQ